MLGGGQVYYGGGLAGYGGGAFVKALSEVPLKKLAPFGETVKSDIRDPGAIVRAGNIKAD